MTYTGIGFEHNVAYGQNIRGFPAFGPLAFGYNPATMEQYHYAVYGPGPKFHITEAVIAGAAAFKAVQESPKVFRTFPINMNIESFYSQTIANVRANAARETQILLQRYPLPGVDPEKVIISAEEGAHRLYDHLMNFD